MKDWVKLYKSCNFWTARKLMLMAIKCNNEDKLSNALPLANCQPRVINAATEKMAITGVYVVPVCPAVPLPKNSLSLS